MPEVRRLWAESQFVKTNCCHQVDFCPFRGPDAPFALSEPTTKLEAGTTVGISRASDVAEPTSTGPRGRAGSLGANFLVRGLEVKIGEIASVSVMERDELPSRLRKIDFSAFGFVPDVPHDPIGKVLERKLFCRIERQLAVGSRLAI